MSCKLAPTLFHSFTLIMASQPDVANQHGPIRQATSVIGTDASLRTGIAVAGIGRVAKVTRLWGIPPYVSHRADLMLFWAQNVKSESRNPKQVQDSKFQGSNQRRPHRNVEFCCGSAVPRG
jgi:hypothetical protein